MTESNTKPRSKFMAVLFGWLLFIVVTILGFFIVSRVLISVLDKLLSVQDLGVLFYFLLANIAIFITGYLGLIISVKWVVIPYQSKSNNSNVVMPSARALFYEWLGYCFYYLVYCSPLLLISRIPDQIIPENIQSIISTVWMMVVSFVVYRSFFIAVISGKRLQTSI